MNIKQYVLLSCFSGIAHLFGGASDVTPADVRTRLLEWRTGVWIGGGGYAIYTPTHYFLISANGDPKNANIYCGASQMVYHNKGIAWRQNVRVRLAPGMPPHIITQEISNNQKQEPPLVIDPKQFDKNICHWQGDVLYFVITEVTNEYITLAECDGDREKIFSDGRSVYLPKKGGEIWSYRVERIK